MSIQPGRLLALRGEHLHDIAAARRVVADREEQLDDARRDLEWNEHMLARFEASVEHARDSGLIDDHPCRGCGNPGWSTPEHVYGQRTCCPDCDHRPPVTPETPVTADTPAG